MDDPRAARLVKTVLRCYPARWRRRHGDEAAELAALLIGDGTPAVSVAWSYLAGAAPLDHCPGPQGGDLIKRVIALPGQTIYSPIKGSSIVGQVVLVWWHDGHPDFHMF
jgi:hypothetical protein